MAARIVVADEAGRRRAVELAAEVLVGRGAECALRLAARDVSRRHARFSCASGAAWVEDLGSRNGTFVNGDRLRGRRRLRGGDVVRVGEELLRFDDGETTADGDEPVERLSPPPLPPPLPGRTPPPLPGRAPPQPRGLRAALAAALRALAARNGRPRP
jgi:FHA domain